MKKLLAITLCFLLSSNSHGAQPPKQPQTLAHIFLSPKTIIVSASALGGALAYKIATKKITPAAKKESETASTNSIRPDGWCPHMPPYPIDGPCNCHEPISVNKEVSKKIDTTKSTKAPETANTNTAQTYTHCQYWPPYPDFSSSCNCGRH